MIIEQLTYTDVRRGEGFSPNRAGYQIKACSDGLCEQERELLADVCMHYGDVVYRSAPREALDCEMTWRMETEQLDCVPQEILDRFPRILCYLQLDENRYALARVRYVGLTHDQRTGNFFAHVLVFAPDCLASGDFSPARLARSNMLLRENLQDAARLPSLSTLPASEPNDLPWQWFGESPYCDHTGALFSALLQSSNGGRPLVIRLARWEVAAPLVEALLSLLPSPLRCHTTFCTYESGRDWSPYSSHGRSGERSLYDVVVVYGGNDLGSKLRLDGMAGKCTLFDFVDSQFSPVAPFAPVTAEAVAHWVADGDADQLAAFHEAVEQACDPTAWDRLLTEVGLCSGAVPEPTPTDTSTKDDRQTAAGFWTGLFRRFF